MDGFGGLSRYLGKSWASSWEVLGSLWHVLGSLGAAWRRLERIGGDVGDGLGEQGARKRINCGKRVEGIRVKGGSGDHLDTEIYPRRREIKEKTN